MMAIISDRERISVSELMTIFRRDVSAFEMDRIISTLDMMDAIDMVESTQGKFIEWRRPKEITDGSEEPTKPS